MATKRKALLISQNSLKYAEIKSLLGRYNITLDNIDKVDSIEGILVNQPYRFIFQEESNLYNQQTNEISLKNKALEAVYNQCDLKVFLLNEFGELSSRKYSHKIEGYIVLNLKIIDEEVFGWDDIFVVASTGMTYHEMKKLGLKISSRDQVFSAFLKEFLHFDEHIDLKWSPLNSKRTIDFSLNGVDIIGENPYFSYDLLKKHGLQKPLYTVLSQGIFFRAPSNHRERNYWAPGLNGGVPLTVKQDALHESTYMFHDLMHHLIPDLIFTTGSFRNEKSIYVIYRMLSEAITLCLADMLFIDCVADKNENYDFTKRQIFPLYKSLQKNLSLKELLLANAEYALLGDDNRFKKHGANEQALSAYKEKYSKYFIEDYRWTAANAQSMSEQGQLFNNWVSQIPKELIKKLGLIELSSFARDIKNTNGLREIVHEVFEKIYKLFIEPVFSSDIEMPDRQKSGSMAFKRYMLGQTLIFSKFSFVTSSQRIFQAIIHQLQSHDILSAQAQQEIRNLYTLFIDHLKQQEFISQDDAIVYKEVYTYFEPFYIHYDAKKLVYDSIWTAAKDLLPL